MGQGRPGEGEGPTDRQVSTEHCAGSTVQTGGRPGPDQAATVGQGRPGEGEGPTDRQVSTEHCAGSTVQTGGRPGPDQAATVGQGRPGEGEGPADRKVCRQMDLVYTLTEGFYIQDVKLT